MITAIDNWESSDLQKTDSAVCAALEETDLESSNLVRTA
jgi:hypothetical protein